MDDYDFDDFFTFDYDSFGVHDNYGNNGYSHGSTYDSNSHGGQTTYEPPVVIEEPSTPPLVAPYNNSHDNDEPDDDQGNSYYQPESVESTTSDDGPEVYAWGYDPYVTIDTNRDNWRLVSGDY